MQPESSYWASHRRLSLTRRRLLGVAASGITLAAGAACGGASGRPAGTGTTSSPSQTPQPGGVFEASQKTSATTLDPHRTTSFYTEVPAGAVMSRLLRFKTGLDSKVGENHEVESDLAASVESPDAITWTVKLRPDARFHNVAPVNGRAVQADDVRLTFVRAVGTENPGRAGLDMIDGSQIQAPSPDTVVFKLKYPYAPFKTTLASATYSWIMPREGTNGGYDPAKQMIGSGPFVLDSYTPDVAFVLKKNQNWFEKSLPYADGVHLSIIPDAGQARAQFTGGHLDSLGDTGGVQISSNDLESLKRDNPKAFVTKNAPGSGEQELFFSLGDTTSPFQDVRLRRAVSMAIDRDAIAKAIYNNDAQRQYFVYLWLGKWAMGQNELPPDVSQYYKYDPAGAKKLLTESGFADVPFKLIFVTGYLGAQYEQASQTVASMLSTAGFKVTAVQVDYQKDYIGGGKGIRYGNYERDMIISASPSGYDSADEFIFNYYDSKSTAGLSRLKDSTLDGMIDKARTLLDENERVKSYIDVQKYLADKVYTVAGFPTQSVYTMTSPRIMNYQHSVTYGYLTESTTKLWLKG
jgi:peptide/nickel transport system substrate-binding protein